MSALSKKQAYQLRIQRSYAGPRGLPLDLPAAQPAGYSYKLYGLGFRV